LLKEKPGVIIDEVMYDASAFGEDYTEHFFETGGLQRLQEYIQQNQATLSQIRPGTRLGAAVARPSKLVCIGLNYARHAQETGAAIPAEPVVFFKSTTALCGPQDDLIIPKNSVKTDWEVELAVVISKKTSYIQEEDAADHIAGYVLHNDYSERAYQLERNGQWVKGKSCDTFAPLGPYLATADELKDPQDLDMWLSVNGEKLQDSNTSDMVFKIPFLIHYLSQFMTLLPGDVISTGTPFGVGLGFKPPRYLRAGDVVALGIEGLGTQRQRAISYEEAVKNGFY
jgi:2,4-diketo-3-deoxy-L-fuconate hydrolase